MKDFKNKVIVITGVGSGIGRALAIAFAKSGAKLALNDFKAASLNETCALVKKEGAEIFETSFDVSSREAVAKFADEVVKHFGRVDIVINNAGIGLGDYFVHEVDLNLFERVMQINFYGVLYGSHYFIPHLLKQPESALVNISSVFGLTGIGKSGAYCASKFAVHGLNQCMWNEYADTNMTVHSVHPGGINTNITQNSLDYKSVTDTKLHDAFQKEFLKLTPDYAASVIIEGIKKKKKKILIGAEAGQLDFTTRFFPLWGNGFINKMIKQKLEALGLEKKV
ncbi:MAG: SDR family oxidoreductase [Chitinophagales bacterium]|nr:SDR family oxidoreductase [Chitinophagales bacterium]